MCWEHEQFIGMCRLSCELLTPCSPELLTPCFSCCVCKKRGSWLLRDYVWYAFAVWSPACSVFVVRAVVSCMNPQHTVVALLVCVVVGWP